MHMGPENTLEQIEGDICLVARSLGVPVNHEFAAALMDRLRLRLGGERLYIPRASASDRKRRDAAIRDEFNGRNTAELAERHGVSERRIYAILRGGRNPSARARHQRNSGAQKL